MSLTAGAQETGRCAVGLCCPAGLLQRIHPAPLLSLHLRQNLKQNVGLRGCPELGGGVKLDLSLHVSAPACSSTVLKPSPDPGSVTLSPEETPLADTVTGQRGSLGIG